MGNYLLLNIFLCTGLDLENKEKILQVFSTCHLPSTNADCSPTETRPISCIHQNFKAFFASGGKKELGICSSSPQPHHCLILLQRFQSLNAQEHSSFTFWIIWLQWVYYHLPAIRYCHLGIFLSADGKVDQNSNIFPYVKFFPLYSSLEEFILLRKCFAKYAFMWEYAYSLLCMHTNAGRWAM